jgi:hypothetical protein
MLRRADTDQDQELILQELYEDCLEQMLNDPDLTEEQKQELLRQLELPDEEWEPTELPENAEPVSETIIRMRRGSLE